MTHLPIDTPDGVVTPRRAIVWHDIAGKEIAEPDTGCVYSIIVRGFGLALASRFVDHQAACFDVVPGKLHRERLRSGIYWRLPQLQELNLLADYKSYNPVMPRGVYSQRGEVWTSTPCAWDPHKFYTFDIHTGCTSYKDRTEFAYILPVADV